MEKAFLHGGKTRFKKHGSEIVNQNIENAGKLTQNLKMQQILQKINNLNEKMNIASSKRIEQDHLRQNKIKFLNEKDKHHYKLVQLKLQQEQFKKSYGRLLRQIVIGVLVIQFAEQSKLLLDFSNVGLSSSH